MGRQGEGGGFVGRGLLCVSGSDGPERGEAIGSLRRLIEVWLILWDNILYEGLNGEEWMRTLMLIVNIRWENLG